jgi:hypothetical protein
MATEDYYRPQHYTQEGINYGQRQINYALTQADRALINVLTLLKQALETPAGRDATLVPQINTAIDAAIKAINHVAGIRPPGCDSTWEPKPDPEG